MLQVTFEIGSSGLRILEGSMAGAVEVLALSDDEVTPRSKKHARSRPGTLPCTPITPCNVVCLDSDDELEVQRTPLVSAKLDWREKKLEFDDCFVVKVTPASSKVDGRLKSIVEDDCSFLKETPSSGSRLPPTPRVTTVISDTGVQWPDASYNLPTDWTPHWSRDTTPEVEGPQVESPRLSDVAPRRCNFDATLGTEVAVEEPQAKRPRLSDAVPHRCDFDATVGTEVEIEVQEPQAERPRYSDAAPHRCDFDATVEAEVEVAEDLRGAGAERNAVRGQRISEEERQKRLREKELESERKQAEREQKKLEKEEAKRRQQEEIRQKKEDEKARKAAAKIIAQERRKNEQEVEKFKGKDALKKMKASVDVKIVEKGRIGGQLLSRFEEKHLVRELVKNPMENSITWRTQRPSLDSFESQSQESELGSEDGTPSSQVSYDDVDIQYLVFVFEAEEFARMVAESSLVSHVRKAQRHYLGYTICYVVNRLMSYLQKKDQEQYQANDPANIEWRRPAVEEALAGLVTNFTGVHSRLCVDEAEVADHVTGLMPVLAQAFYKPKLTRLSVRQNGEHVRHEDAFKEEIRQSLWLKALVAIPKVSEPCAVSIGKFYPTMRSLLSIYLDKEKTDREKELLLQDLQRENVFGSGRKIGPACSKQIFRILMAQEGDLKVDKIDQDVHQD